MNINSMKNTSGEDADDTLVFIMREGIIEIEDEKNRVEAIKLRHPRTNQSCRFIYNPNNGIIQEILTFCPKYRSWFIGNTVNSSGKLFLSTSVDPLLLVLPYLLEAKVSSPLDQTVHDEDFPDVEKLLHTTARKCMTLIADQIDLQWDAWKYNEQKTLDWLKQKVLRVVEVLKKKLINVNSVSAVSNTYVKAVCNDNQEAALRYAHGIVSEYLPEQLNSKLLAALDLPAVESVSENKRKRIEEELLNVKKLRQECRENELASQFLTENKVQKKTTRKSAKNVALEKAANKTKSISSYFGKK